MQSQKIILSMSNLRSKKSVAEGLLDGVRYSKNKFQSWISIFGKNTFLGSFDTNLDAGIAFLSAKIERDTEYLAVFKANLKRDKKKLEKLMGDL